EGVRGELPVPVQAADGYAVVGGVLVPRQPALPTAPPFSADDERRVPHAGEHLGQPERVRFGAPGVAGREEMGRQEDLHAAWWAAACSTRAPRARPTVLHSYFAATRSRPPRASRRRSSADLRRPTTLLANSSGPSAIKMFSPSFTSNPSAPFEVET